jgi:hypothetical protein
LELEFEDEDDDEVEEPEDGDEEAAAGVFEGCWSVVAAEPVVFPWLASAATNENRPARPTAPASIQRLMRESNAWPRSRVVGVRGVMAPMVGAMRKRTLSGG